MMRYFLFLVAFFFAFSATAQTNIIENLQTERVGQGTVTIHQDAKISALLGAVYVKSDDEEDPKVWKARV